MKPLPNNSRYLSEPSKTDGALAARARAGARPSSPARGATGTGPGILRPGDGPQKDGPASWCSAP
eukprot:333641-Pyramimonas_sp.AAC.1